MNVLFHCILVALFMLASALFSGLETGGYMLNRLTLRSRVRQRNPRAIRLQRILRDAHLFIFTVLIGNNIAIYLLSRHVTNLYAESGMFSGKAAPFLNAEAAATLTLMLPLFFFAELLPKNLFRTRADTLMYRVSGVLRFFQRLFLPLSLFLKVIFRLLTAGRVRAGALSAFSLSLDGLREYFAGKAAGRSLTSHQHGMIDNVIAMNHTRVSSVMQRRDSVVTASDRASVRDVLQLMSTGNTEQVLVCRRGGRSFCGVVHLDDLLDPQLQLDSAAKPLCRKAVRLSSNQSLPEAFRRLQSSPGGCAVVLDRASRVVGFLRFRDLAVFITRAT